MHHSGTNCMSTQLVLLRKADLLSHHPWLVILGINSMSINTHPRFAISPLLPAVLMSFTLASAQDTQCILIMLLRGTAITGHLVQAQVHHKRSSQAWPRSTLHCTPGCSFPVKHGAHESTSASASLAQESCTKCLATHKPPVYQQDPVLAPAECSKSVPRLPSSVVEHSQDNRPIYSHSAWSVHTRSLSHPH